MKRDAIVAGVPAAEVVDGDAFGAVGKGLAIVADVGTRELSGQATRRY